jgi:hypothetical protein
VRVVEICSSRAVGLVPPSTRRRGSSYLLLDGPAQPGTTVVEPKKPAERTASITVES